MVLKNFILLNGDGQQTDGLQILVKNGIIKEIAAEINGDFDEVLDLNGRYLTPGLVDMHSHLGTDSWPEFDATSDTNEMSSNPVLPQLRSLDGINPDDLGFKIVNRGGVTTALILPGSGNLMGGEAFAIKTRVAESHRVEDMLLNAGMSKSDSWRWMKMACGENPKRVYGSQGIMPESRLGSGWLFRERFYAAKQLKEDQDAWCAKRKKRSKFPRDPALESLVALLRGQVKLNVHCYEVRFSIYKLLDV